MFEAVIRNGSGVETARVRSGKRYRLVFRSVADHELPAGPDTDSSWHRPQTCLLRGVDWNPRTDRVSLMVTLASGTEIGWWEGDIYDVYELGDDPASDEAVCSACWTPLHDGDCWTCAEAAGRARNPDQAYFGGD